MDSYSRLSKILPPDQALANMALSRSLRQIKDVFNSNMPELSQAIQGLESNKGLPLVSALETPIPTETYDFWVNTFATGTGPGNTITTMDLVGTAAGNTISPALSQAGNVLQQMTDQGYLDDLVFDGGSPTNANNGVYTVMQYCLDGAYSTFLGNVIIPAPLPGAGSYANVEAAFSTGLIPAANVIISNIASSYPDLVGNTNQAWTAAATQVSTNYVNLQNAGIDIANVVLGTSTGNLVANNKSSVLSLGASLHDIGLDVEQYGAAEFFEAVANTNNLQGQAVISCMREGRNIALLNAVGVTLDTQLSDINTNVTVSNNLSVGQYTVSEAAGNVIV